MERASLVDAEYHRAFLLGGRAVAADALIVCVMAGVVALNSPWDDASVYVELATCALGLLGLAAQRSGREGFHLGHIPAGFRGTTFTRE